MSNDKDKAKDQKTHRGNPDNSGGGNEQESGYGKSGGNMGAGQSGKENLGTEKPSDGGQAGSRKPEKSE